MSRRAVYTGSFDPITLGHLNVIERSSRLVDELIVGIGTNIEKQPLFTVEERAKQQAKEQATEQASAEDRLRKEADRAARSGSSPTRRRTTKDKSVVEEV